MAMVHRVKKNRQAGVGMKALIFFSGILLGTMVSKFSSPPTSFEEGRNLQEASNSLLSKRTAYELSCNVTGYPVEYDLIVGQGYLSCSFLENGGLFFIVIGILYMFLALAIVCDEFFVPALEELAEGLELSDDVAGATLMAAGGSAPELFTSFLGVFVAQSDVGFGTIVGSAVFNVLFVIGMCAIFSKEVLVLTWWPLARDCSYYTLSLGTLAYFFEFNYEGPAVGINDPRPKQILWWEALILFLMYFGYVFVMKNNEYLYTRVKAFLKKSSSDSVVDPNEPTSLNEIQAEVENSVRQKRASFVRPSKFRAGVLHLMISDKPMLETAGVHVVSQIEGDDRETFRKLSAICIGESSTDNTMNFEEFSAMLRSMHGDAKSENHPTTGECREAFDTIDSDGNGRVSEEEFCSWYKTSEARLVDEVGRAFQLIDTNTDGHIDLEELKAVLAILEVPATESEITKTFGSLDINHDGKITRDEFEEWYESSIFFKNRIRQYSEKQLSDKVEIINEEDEGRYPSYPSGESKSAQALYVISYPLIVLLFSTIPNVARPKYRELYTITFFGSIFWIGVFSYFMVWWASVLGDVLQIPPQVMGLTFLAAGTSVPDLLSSVIVAKQGKGDMAVSSSIGSNIFDVLVGLPLPWLLYTLIKGKPQIVKSQSLGLSVIILLLMLILVVITIAINKWRMTKQLGCTMFFLYLLFVIQDLARAEF